MLYYYINHYYSMIYYCYYCYYYYYYYYWTHASNFPIPLTNSGVLKNKVENSSIYSCNYGSLISDILISVFLVSWVNFLVIFL